MLELIYVRHGQDVNNILRRLPDRNDDTPLTADGRLMASALSLTLTSLSLRPVIYSSPIRRATETAEIIADTVGFPAAAIRLVADLTEVDVGELAGRSDDSAWLIHDAIFGAWMEGHLDEAFPGGEDGHTVRARFYRALSGIANDARGGAETAGKIVVVGHYGIFWANHRGLLTASGSSLSGLPNCGRVALRVPVANPQDSQIVGPLEVVPKPGQPGSHDTA